jgi:glutaminyl-tRNA synthetase
VGVAKYNGVIDIARLENSLRDDLNRRAPRVMAVLRPLRVVIDNYPDSEVEWMEAVNNPEDPSMGTRQVPFSKVIYVEQDDFREDPPKKFFRLSPGREVRLRYAYLATCTSVVKDDRTGQVTEVHCVCDRASRGGSAPDGRRVQGTLHWVSAAHAHPAEVRLYEHLFSKEDPTDAPAGADYKSNLNPNSLTVLKAQVEQSLAAAEPGRHYQFERQGYFFVDPVDSAPGKPVFNRAVSLRDSWARIEKSSSKQG